MLTTFSSPALRVTAALLLLVLCCTCGMVDGRKKVQTQQTSPSTQRAVEASCSRVYSSLFTQENDLENMESRRDSTLFFKHDTLFELNKDYKQRYVYQEACGVKRVAYPEKGYKTVSCSAKTYADVTRTKRGSCQGCCETEMSISVPGTVTNMYDSVTYTAKHFALSYQLVNLGHCTNNGAACDTGGSCTQSYRIQWILVDSDSGDMFVPTSVPSHCTCAFI